MVKLQNNKIVRYSLLSVVILIMLCSLFALSACGSNSASTNSNTTTDRLVQEYYQQQEKVDKVLTESLSPEEKETYDLIVNLEYDWSGYDALREFLCGYSWHVAYIVGNDDDFVEITERTPSPPDTMIYFERSGKAHGQGRDEARTSGYWIPCENGKIVKYIDRTGKATAFTITGDYLSAQSDDGTRTYTFKREM